MKIRLQHVSNSSSSSYIVAISKRLYDSTDEFKTYLQEHLKLEDYNVREDFANGGYIKDYDSLATLFLALLHGDIQHWMDGQIGETDETQYYGAQPLKSKYELETWDESSDTARRSIDPDMLLFRIICDYHVESTHEKGSIGNIMFPFKLPDHVAGKPQVIDLITPEFILSHRWS